MVPATDIWERDPNTLFEALLSRQIVRACLIPGAGRYLSGLMPRSGVPAAQLGARTSCESYLSLPARALGVIKFTNGPPKVAIINIRLAVAS